MPTYYSDDKVDVKNIKLISEADKAKLIRSRANRAARTGYLTFFKRADQAPLWSVYVPANDSLDVVELLLLSVIDKSRGKHSDKQEIMLEVGQKLVVRGWQQVIAALAEIYHDGFVDGLQNAPSASQMTSADIAAASANQPNKKTVAARKEAIAIMAGKPARKPRVKKAGL